MNVLSKFIPGVGFKIKTFQLFFLLVLPLCYFVIGYLYREANGYMFIRCVDPEYAYLFNGLLIGNMKLNIQYTDHPGTPAQCFIAIISRIVHLFRPGLSYTDDVLTNPEYYLKAVLLAANIINTLALLLLGFVVQKLCRNSITALFFQLAPFSHALTLSDSGRLMPELIMTALLCLWMIAIAWLLFTDEPEKIYKKLSIFFGILVGLNVADKLTFVPFIIIPLIVLPSWRFKLRYLTASVLSFMVFAFTIVLNFNNFKIWIRNLFIHSGRYGSGPSNIVNVTEFNSNIRLLIGNSPFIFYLTLTLFGISILLFLIYKTKRSELKVPFRISVGTSLAVITGFLFVAKHFAYHYLIPFMLLTPVMVYLIVHMLNRTLLKDAKPVWSAILLVVSGSYILFSTLFVSVKEIKQISDKSSLKWEAYNNIKPYLNEKTDKIIIPSYYGCSASEYSMMFGMHMIGKHKEYLFDIVNGKFPNTYIFLPWTRSFFYWHNLVMPEVFVKHGKVYLLFIADYSEQQLKLVLDSMKENMEGFDFELEKIYYEPLSNEAVFHLKVH
jgi:hypothetical protein